MGAIPALFSDAGIIAFSLFACLVALTALVANASVLLAFFTSKRLRKNQSNYFAVNLALSDIFVCICPLPLWLLNLWHIRTLLVSSKEIIPKDDVSAYAIVWQFFDAFFTVASVFNLALLSIERYLAIAKPLWHRTKISKRVMLAACLLPWIYAMVSIGPSLALEPGTVLIIAYKIGVILLPCFVMIAAYGLVLVHIVKDKQARSTAVITAAIVSDSLTTNRTPMHRRNLKLTLRLSLLTFAFILCWLPFICWIMWYTTSGKVESIESRSYFFNVSIMLKYLSYFNSFINPFLYVFGRPAFSRVLKEYLMTGKTVKSRRLQRSVLAPPLSLIGSTLSITTINSIHSDAH